MPGIRMPYKARVQRMHCSFIRVEFEKPLSDINDWRVYADIKLTRLSFVARRKPITLESLSLSIFCL